MSRPKFVIIQQIGENRKGHDLDAVLGPQFRSFGIDVHYKAVSRVINSMMKDETQLFKLYANNSDSASGCKIRYSS